LDVAEMPMPGLDDDVAAVEADHDDFEFSVVWPDGSEELTEGAVADIDELVADEPVFTETDDGDLEFSMPPLTLSDEPEAADAEVPDDVADAVRRAIAAIESASVGEPDVDVAVDVDVDFDFDLDLDLDAVGDVDIDVADVADVADVTEAAELDVLGADEVDTELAAPQVDIEITEITEVAEEPAASANGFGAFAPPTMATRAEVLYGQMSGDGAVIDASGTVAVPTLAPQTLAASPAGATSDHGGDRASALRRLIGSLRRKDH